MQYQNAVDIAANYSAVGAEAELHECVGQKHDAWRCKTAEGGCCTLAFSLFYIMYMWSEPSKPSALSRTLSSVPKRNFTRFSPDM